MSKTVSDKLRAYLLSQGIEGIPANNTALFNVLQDHGIAQPTPGGKAIWKATVTSDAGWEHSFTFLKLAPAAIWEVADRPDAFAGSVQPELTDEGTPPPGATADVSTAAEPHAKDTDENDPPPPEKGDDGINGLLDLLDDATAPTPEPVVLPQPETSKPAGTKGSDKPIPHHQTPSGEHFMAWLRQSIQTRKLIINDAKALVHTVDGTAYLISPGVFQRYAQEYPQVATLAKEVQLPAWQWTQKRFEKLGLHRKQANGLNIWTCEVKGPRKTRRVHGYLLNDIQALFDEALPDNPYLNIVRD